MTNKRLAVLLQLALATALVAAWVAWRQWSSDCSQSPSGCEDDIFTEVVRSPDPAPEPLPFEVEYGGCKLIVAPSPDTVECIYDPEVELRVWVTYPRVDEIRVTLDDAPWPRTAAPYSVREELGQGVREVLPYGAQRLRVEVPNEHPWELRLRSSNQLTAREQGILADLDVRATRLQGFLYLGRLDELPAVESMIDELRAQGMLSLAVDEALAASNHLTEQVGRLDLAASMLERVRDDAARYPEGRAALSIYEARVLATRGRLVEAALGYREGGRYSLRTDDEALQLDALADYALVLSELGYFEAALYWGSRALAIARDHGRPADRVAVKIMVARVSLRLREAGFAYDAPEPLLREILAHAGEPPDLADPGEREPARLGLAWSKLLDGELGDALRELDAIDTTALTPDERVMAQGLRLQLLVDNGAAQADVASALAELEALVRSTASLDALWLAAVRRGQVLEHGNDPSGARAAYEESERLLDRLVPLAQLGTQGDIAPARRREGTQRLVSLLLAQGRADEALCALRRAQARLGQLAGSFAQVDPAVQGALNERLAAYLRAKREHLKLLRGDAEHSPAERAQAEQRTLRLRQELDQLALEILADRVGQAGTTSCEALSPRLPGELLIGLYPYRSGLLVLVQDDEETTHRELLRDEELRRMGDPRWFGATLLDPLDARIERATRVRVLASGKAASIDLHALPWKGRPLLEQRAVVYGMDLPPRPPQHVRGGPPTALVLTDVRAKDTASETEAVTKRLGAAGWSVTRKRSSELTAAELQAELSHVDHFHYAGHADYGTPGSELLFYWPPYLGGAAAEPSHIVLGETERLDVRTILVGDAAPRSVVLMGCNTGVYDDRSEYGGFSLATAFLAAGAEVVVASTRDVDGAEASLVGQGLYAELRGRDVGEPGEWFRRAMSWAQRNGRPELAVGSYRVLVR